MNEVQQAVASANVNLPTGTLYGKDRMFAVQATGQLYDARAFQSVIVTYRNGIPVRLGEVGRVIDSVQTDKVAAWFKDKRGIVLAIQRQPGTNTIEVVDAVKKLLPTFRAEVPPSIGIDILYDRTVMIRASVEEVEFTLLLALALVVMVIFLFLRNIPATIIPSVALPMSIVGTFSLMYLFGYSMDNISLMALTLCVGFVVDDAIVMLENISRHIEMGKSVDAGDAGRLEGDRLHHRVDDHLARRGVHPGVLHGRHPRPAAARVRGGDHRRGADLGLRLAHADADDVQPHPQAARRRTGATAACTWRSNAASTPGATSTAATLRWVLAHQRATHDRVSRHLRGDRRAVRARAQGLPAERGLGPAVRLHRGAAGRVLRGHGRSCSARLPRSCARTRTSRRSCRSSARATSTRR